MNGEGLLLAAPPERLRTPTNCANGRFSRMLCDLTYSRTEEQQVPLIHSGDEFCDHSRTDDLAALSMGCASCYQSSATKTSDHEKDLKMKLTGPQLEILPTDDRFSQSLHSLRFRIYFQYHEIAVFCSLDPSNLGIGRRPCVLCVSYC